MMIKDTYTGGNWPGELCTKTSQTYNGMTIRMWEYNGDKTDSPTHIIFNNAAAYTLRPGIYVANGRKFVVR